jgi:hypothetical protein
MMKIRSLALAFVLFVVCFTVSCSSNSARTYYDSLALDTPGHAVESFISAYQKSDFQTVYLILAPRAQRKWQENYSLLNWPALIHVDTPDDPLVIQMIDETDIADGQFEHSGQTSYEFDEIMLAAQSLDLLIVDLSGTTKIGETQEARDTVGNPATDVFVTSSQYDTDLVFRTVQAPSGKWRVYQVFLPGGSDELVPWAMPIAGQ